MRLEFSGNIPTSSVPFVETEHGRLRRKQRGIDKKDLQKALKYGRRDSTHPRPNGDSTGKYTYNNIVYIVNERTHEEITSYATPLELEPVPIKSDALTKHRIAKGRIDRDLACWTSNTVFVVDISGSMKSADVWGTRDRLSAIWISIALDFLAHRLETGIAKTTDIVSIVTLEQNPRIIIHEEPTSWALYNKIVNIYKHKTVPPRGHGPFLPALDVAVELLTKNSNASCALALLFLSDGKPSDAAMNPGFPKEKYEADIVHQVETLAKPFGRRLNFTTIGVGDFENFRTLELMAEAAKEFLAVARFSKPFMNSVAIGEIFTELSSNLTTTQTEMTDLNTSTQQKVKPVLRESRKLANEKMTHISPKDFHIYKKSRAIRSVWTESFEDGIRRTRFKTIPLQQPSAQFVALAKGPFGEGAERFAYRFFELGPDAQTIVGSPLVAKESRLLLEGGENGNEKQRLRFAEKFCSTQQIAGRLANGFNDTLDTIEHIHDLTPRVSFLDCSVYQLNDRILGKCSVLVEEKMDHDKWFKWNTNNGYVAGMAKAPVFSEEAITSAMNDVNLGIIEEGSEDEDEDEDEGEDEDEDEDERSEDRIRAQIFSPLEVAQAFSHYTYLASNRKRLVCDLQGIFDEKANILQFSDPVIHYNSSQGRTNVHGRTDKGVKGCAMFFETHYEHCGYLCKLVTRRFRKNKYRKKRYGR